MRFARVARRLLYLFRNCFESARKSANPSSLQFQQNPALARSSAEWRAKLPARKSATTCFEILARPTCLTAYCGIVARRWPNVIESTKSETSATRRTQWLPTLTGRRLSAEARASCFLMSNRRWRCPGLGSGRGGSGDTVGMTETEATPPLLLSDEEITALTGYKRGDVQLADLHKQGFLRARRNAMGHVVLERAHYEAVCAGYYGSTQRGMETPKLAFEEKRTPRLKSQRLKLGSK